MIKVTREIRILCCIIITLCTLALQTCSLYISSARSTIERANGTGYFIAMASYASGQDEAKPVF